MAELPEQERFFRLPRIGFEAGSIIFIALFLGVFGIIVQNSAGQDLNTPRLISVTLGRQVVFLAIAIVVGALALCVNLNRVRRFSAPIFVAAVFCLLLIYVPGLGKMVNGACRWIELIPGVRLQVSDPAKIALVIALSDYIARFRRYMLPPQFRWFEKSKFGFPVPTAAARENALWGFIAPCAILGTICGLIALEPDLGTMLLSAAVGFSMLVLAGIYWRYVIPTILVGVSALSVIISFWANRSERITSFLFERSYQIEMSLTGLASGGATGQGLGDGLIRAGVPEAHTDCVFAVVGEEFGFFVAVWVPIGFLILFLLAVSQLRKITDTFYFNVCLGSLLFVVLQAAINLGVVLDLLPPKGMSLPFISYGGSNLVVMSAFIGIVCNCMQNWQNNVLPKPTDIGNDT